MELYSVTPLYEYFFVSLGTSSAPVTPDDARHVDDNGVCCRDHDVCVARDDGDAGEEGGVA